VHIICTRYNAFNHGVTDCVHCAMQVYDLGFNSANLVEDPAGLRAHGLPIPTNDSSQAAAAWKYWEQPSDGSEFACAYNTSGPAVVLAAGDANSRQPSARSCAEACRCRFHGTATCNEAIAGYMVPAVHNACPSQLRAVTAWELLRVSALQPQHVCGCSARQGCTAWFWCKDAQRRPCLDAQSGTWVQHHGCALLQLPVLPAAPPEPGDLNFTDGTDRIRSFAASYIKRADGCEASSVVA
jgi:hypothetical protein